MQQPAATEQEQHQAVLESLRGQDDQMPQIVAYSKFVVAYLLQQDGPNPGWRKANIEGPVYVVRRRTEPRYQVLVKNQFSKNDLLDTVHWVWELDCQKNYMFYKVEDPVKRIRGLWFHDDSERQKIEQSLEKVVEDLRIESESGTAEFQLEPQPGRDETATAAQMAALHSLGLSDTARSCLGLTEPAKNDFESRPAITITKESLRAALHSLADDEAFLEMVINKLKSRLRDSG